MNELVLFIIIAVLLFGSQLLVSRVRKPLLHYIRVIASIALLILVWLFSKDSNVPIKVILTAVVLTVLYKEYGNLKKTKAS